MTEQQIKQSVAKEYKLKATLVWCEYWEHYSKKYKDSIDKWKCINEQSQFYVEFKNIVGSLDEISYTLLTDKDSLTHIKENDEFITYWRIHDNKITKICIYKK